MAGESPEKRDWRVSAVLLAVWVVALVFIAGRRDDIPLSMIAMATVFFVILIPAMNDLVRSLERRVGGNTGDDRHS
jgi:cobalamin synthase